MVRENNQDDSGVDANKNVELEKVLKDEGKWTGETIDPEHTSNLEPIDIRADIADPDKKG
jgi:hypothetical protein